MEMTKFAQAIKQELSMELNKQGYTIDDFEQALRNINTGEGVFNVVKMGSAIMTKEAGLTDMASDALSFLPEAALKTSLVGGAAGGLSFDEMDKSVDHMNKSLDREREKIKLVQRITQNLKREHGIL
jgi:hypothetical protein